MHFFNMKIKARGVGFYGTLWEITMPVTLEEISGPNHEN